MTRKLLPQHLSPSVQRSQTNNPIQTLNPSASVWQTSTLSTNTAKRTTVFSTETRRATTSSISTQPCTTHATSHLNLHPPARHTGRRYSVIVKPVLPKKSKTNASVKQNSKKKRKMKILSSLLPTEPRRVVSSASRLLLSMPLRRPNLLRLTSHLRRSSHPLLPSHLQSPNHLRQSNHLLLPDHLQRLQPLLLSDHLHLSTFSRPQILIQTAYLSPWPDLAHSPDLLLLYMADLLRPTTLLQTPDLRRPPALL
jgi:hypothetical protein